MSRRPSYATRRSEGPGVLSRALLVIVLLAGIVVGARGAFRAGRPPSIEIAPGAKAIGVRTPVAVTVAEPARGLTEITIELVQSGRAETVAHKTYEPRSSWAFSGTKTDSETFRFDVGRSVQKSLKAAPATIRVTAARAASWLRHPAPAVSEVTLPVRFTPPTLAVLSNFTYVNQGGCEAVVYRVGETSVKDGVTAGGWFFPGFPLPAGGAQDRFALFAVPYDLGDASAVKLTAEDDVGNAASVAFIDKFFARPLRRDTIPLDDAFLAKVVPSILSQTPDLTDKGDLLENYLQINRDLRKTDNAQLVALAKDSRPSFLWTRPFQPMGSTKVMASFADRRTYVYKGRSVDQQDHLGLDLAGVAHAPVPAANDGIVVLARFFGIYGNTVVVDHGYGLMSLYGHLSSIDVKEGQTIARGQAVGRSGDTGLAGGDHLHFAILLQGLPVSPVEWWDAHWLADRIARKLGPAFPLAR
ncbi:MAG TPA: M23 family metallopeptidase [Candidatus Polarisedimenticolaceae bacterium]|nr:M23 family metallopeptidase [Candidatus Polarisedimenticolaceae bacterium]